MSGLAGASRLGPVPPRASMTATRAARGLPYVRGVRLDRDQTARNLPWRVRLRAMQAYALSATKHWVFGVFGVDISGVRRYTVSGGRSYGRVGIRQAVTKHQSSDSCNASNNVTELRRLHED
ncbi:hypothetical protein GCM10008901_06210 [Bifidobacterium pullorum]